MALDWGDPTPRFSRSLLERVFRYPLPYWPQALGVVVCIGAIAAFGLVPALVTRGLVDELAHPSGTMDPFYRLVAAAIGALLGGGLFGVLQSYLSTAIGQGIAFDIRRQLFERLLIQSVGFFTHRRSGDLMARIYSDAVGVQSVVGDTLFGLVSSLITLTSTLALMLALDWKLTLATTVLLPLVLGPSRYVGHATFSLRKQVQEKFGEMAAYLQEILGISGTLLVKAFTRERSEKQRFAALNGEVRRLEIAQRWWGVGLAC